MRKLVLLAAFALSAFALNAQNTPTAGVKIGYVDVNYILANLPDVKKVEADLKSLQTQLKNSMDAKYNEFQKKLTDYQNAVKAGTIPDAVRANTERELAQLQENLQKLQEDAQTSLQAKEQQLMDPIYTKVGDAIKGVAKDMGLGYILSQKIGGLDVILYADEQNDVSDAVLKKMGVTPKPAAPAANNQPK